MNHSNTETWWLLLGLMLCFFSVQQAKRREKIMRYESVLSYWNNRMSAENDTMVQYWIEAATKEWYFWQAWQVASSASSLASCTFENECLTKLRQTFPVWNKFYSESIVRRIFTGTYTRRSIRFVETFLPVNNMWWIE